MSCFSFQFVCVCMFFHIASLLCQFAVASSTEDLLAALPEPPVCGVSKGTFNRVVGGDPAKLGDFPWMAVVGYKIKGIANINWKCGGSLISSRHVLTAAHCILDDENISHYMVRLGELDLIADDDGATPTEVRVKTTKKHEFYNATAFANDIGILLLEKDVQFTDLIRPICIPKDPELRSKTFERYNPFLAGWGHTKYKGAGAAHLQKVQLPVVSNKACAEAYMKFTTIVIDERNLCAGYTKGGKSSCQGDSGGPLMQPILDNTLMEYFFYQIGVVSFGQRCAEPGYPGIYTRVTTFLPWIEKNL